MKMICSRYGVKIEIDVSSLEEANEKQHMAAKNCEYYSHHVEDNDGNIIATKKHRWSDFVFIDGASPPK